jgi:hypothetical protein
MYPAMTQHSDFLIVGLRSPQMATKGVEETCITHSKTISTHIQAEKKHEKMK